MNTLPARLFRLIHRRKVAALAGIPGPTPRFPFGNALDFLGKRPWEVLAGYGRAHGGMALAWIGGKPVVVLNDPDLIARVFRADSVDYYKDAPRQALEPVITRRCLFIANGPDWARRRANHPCAGPAADGWLDGIVPTLRDSVRAGARRLASADPAPGADLHDGLQRVAFDAFAVAVWGDPLGDEAYAQFVALGKVGDRRMRTPLSLLPPLCPLFYRDRRRWYGRFDALIERARRDPDPSRRDLLAVTLRHGSPLDHADLRDLLANAFYGGVYSVSSCLTTALYLLARDPDEAARLRADLEHLDLAAPDLDPAALGAAPRLEATVRESLRTLAAVPLMARNVTTARPVELGGHTLPPDTTLVLTNWLINRSPDHWPDPDRFDPGRWLDPAKPAGPIAGPHFFPFGQGNQTCVGMPFAMTYMKVALAVLTKDFRVAIDPDQPYRQAYFFGVMIPRGFAARFEPATPRSGVAP